MLAGLKHTDEAWAWCVAAIDEVELAAGQVVPVNSPFLAIQTEHTPESLPMLLLGGIEAHG